MAKEQEDLEGFVVDIACLRKWPHDEVAKRARQHTRTCSLEGHCVESGFGLVDDKGRIQLLDAAATPKVIEVVRGSRRCRGVRLRAFRRAAEGGELETEAVAEVPSYGSGTGHDAGERTDDRGRTGT